MTPYQLAPMKYKIKRVGTRVIIHFEREASRPPNFGCRMINTEYGSIEVLRSASVEISNSRVYLPGSYDDESRQGASRALPSKDEAKRYLARINQALYLRSIGQRNYLVVEMPNINWKKGGHYAWGQPSGNTA